MYDFFPKNETTYTICGSLVPNLNYTQHAINSLPTWDLNPQWHSLRCLSGGVTFQDWSIWCFLVCCNFIFSLKFSLFPFYFCVLPFCVLPTSLLHLSFSKDEDFYLQHTLLVLSSVFVRRDSSVIKEEIKAFLANRRISQAVVAQVTGKSRRALYSRIVSRLCHLCRCWNITYISVLQPCQLGHGDGSLGFKPVPARSGTCSSAFF